MPSSATKCQAPHYKGLETFLCHVIVVAAPIMAVAVVEGNTNFIWKMKYVHNGMAKFTS